MADDRQLALLKTGVSAWNEWRARNPSAKVDLSDAFLMFTDLRGANLDDANLKRAYLDSANLIDASSSHAALSSANLDSAALT